MIYPVPGIMKPGREQASRQVASPFVDSETAEVRFTSTGVVYEVLLNPDRFVLGGRVGVN
jgi:hypothetical protein